MHLTCHACANLAGIPADYQAEEILRAQPEVATPFSSFVSQLAGPISCAKTFLDLLSLCHGPMMQSQMHLEV
eukprot:160542-Amphidinium_carterae.1